MNDKKADYFEPNYYFFIFFIFLVVEYLGLTAGTKPATYVVMYTWCLSPLSYGRHPNCYDHYPNLTIAVIQNRFTAVMR
jgi:hypothetical protein